MKDLFAQFNDGRLSPHERQTRAIEGIWKALDGIDRSLSKISAKNMSEIIANDLSMAMNESIDKSFADEAMTQYPHTWSDERKKQVKDRFGNRPRNYAIKKDKEMMAWLAYNWNNYCDKYANYKKHGGRKPRVLDLMQAIGSKFEYDCQSKRLFVSKTNLMSLEDYSAKKKIETT